MRNGTSKRGRYEAARSCRDVRARIAWILRKDIAHAVLEIIRIEIDYLGEVFKLGFTGIG